MPSMPPSPPGSDLPPAVAAALDAARPGIRLSPQGARVWAAGAGALIRLGRGDAVALDWIAAAPLVARDLGEDLLPDLLSACMGFASRTSGAVIARILATAPVAAGRLGDAGLFRAWLGFLDHLLARAPRGVRPMLDHLPDLLNVLTLSGLRGWADWGADAHRTDLPELERYFGLETEASRAVLKQQRKGLLLVDVQRRLSIYLRALWGRDFLILPTDDAVPHFTAHALHLPDALDDWNGIPALDLYRAQAAHLAAHLAALRRPYDAMGLTPLQQTAIGLIEDARAEALAIARFPRLRDFWARFHRAEAPGTAGRLDAIARALLTGETAGDPLADWALTAFRALDLTDQDAALALGLSLADRLRALPFSPHHDQPTCLYRDDNRLLWDGDEMDWDTAKDGPAQLRRNVSVMEMVNEVEVETAGDDAQEVWVQSSEFFDDDGTSLNEREGKPAEAPPVMYDEFDHRLQMLRPAWVTLRERRPAPGDPGLADRVLSDNRAVMERLRLVIAALQPQGVQRIRRLEEGDTLDLDAAIRAAVDRRTGRDPDPRVMMRNRRHVRDIAVLVLLDLSESTNDPTAIPGQTILDLTKSAAMLLAEAISRVGDPFALHGFCSDGRSDVRYARFKDFDRPWDNAAKARLAGVEGRLSTRMGAAIRHATALMAQRRAAKRLMLVVTDGAPADIDVRDPLYLRQDARAAVEEAGRQGITPFCLTLDPGADAYASRIFGPRNVAVLDRVERLPEKLPQLYARLTR